VKETTVALGSEGSGMLAQGMADEEPLRSEELGNGGKVADTAAANVASAGKSDKPSFIAYIWDESATTVALICFGRVAPWRSASGKVRTSTP
jgi:hypothetical protein